MSLSPTATSTPRACPKCGQPTRRTHLCWRCECPGRTPTHESDPEPCFGCGKPTRRGPRGCKRCEAARLNGVAVFDACPKCKGRKLAYRDVCRACADAAASEDADGSAGRRRADRELAAMIGRYEAARCDRARVAEAAKLEALIAGRLASEAAADPNRHLLLVVGGYAYQPAAGGRELMRWKAERPVYGTLANP